MIARLGASLILLASAGIASTAWAQEAPSPATTSPATPESIEQFKSQVRPLLTSHCVKCHGGAKTEGKFDLTTRQSLLEGAESGPVVVPGKAQESLLYKVIAHAQQPFMPHEADKLPPEAIAQIATWLDAGAPYDAPLLADSGPEVPTVVPGPAREFWSFRPLARAPLPSVTSSAWCRTPIDQFVLAALESRGLAANAEADRRKLIRRAYFDLLGLPPTPERVEAFLADPRPDAYEQLIDELLASPHYGERWGRYWLDLARFAESHGYEQDYDRPSAYHFRDFVIQALNQDMPYDQFVRWQVAGDELAPDDPLAMMATGFLGAGTHATQITANQVEKERYDELDDMAATVGTAMLGLTVGCARCHDHKFDPIPQHDYYRFVANFTTTVRSEIELDLHPEKYQQARRDFDLAHAPLVEARERFERDELPTRLATWLASDPAPPQPRWLALEAESLTSTGGATFTLQADGSYLASGPSASMDTYTFVARTPLTEIKALKLEALADPSLVRKGPGRAENGNFALSDWRVTAAPADGSSPAVAVQLVNPRASFEQAGLPIAAALDDNPTSGWAVDPRFGENHAAVVEFGAPVGYSGGTLLTVTLKFEINQKHSIGRARLSISTSALPAELEGEQASHDLIVGLAEILRTPSAERTAEQQASLLSWFRTTDSTWRALNQAVLEHEQQAPRPELVKVMVCSEGLPAIRLHTQGADFFEETFYLKRGDLRQKQSAATPGFFQVLTRGNASDDRWREAPPAGARTSYRRRALAHWLTDPDEGAGNLLARVMVNRLWQHHMGRGLVSTASDFGAQGERPSHPELLDWLASELVTQGWRLKPLHKLIMTSNAYRQGSQYDEARAATDPENIYLWRHVPRRLEAEAVRDVMLAVSGTLDETMYGPGSLDEAQRRRSIYFTIKRSQLIPFMVLFDAPEPLQGIGVRPSTTIAPQALALLNNSQVRAWAHAFAERSLARSAASAPDAIRFAFLAALGRPPADDEASASLEFYEHGLAAYRAASAANAEARALADVCQALFSLNEFIYAE